jgi:V8-like Glu-specific endopeptidase
MGDTAVIELHPQHDISEISMPPEELEKFGVVIDQFTRGYSQDRLSQLIGDDFGIQSICGKKDHEDVICYSSSHSTEYDRSHAVAKILLNNGRSYCTGWRVGYAVDTMLTNEHCISSQFQVNRAEAWFNYQKEECGKDGNAEVTKVAGKTLLIDDYTLDFALFTVKSPDKISSFGYLELDPREPILDEEIYIPQHPEGHPKKFGIESDKNERNICRIDDEIMDGRGEDTDTGYYCDTRPGSSGSPVMALSSHRAIGLHHMGGCLNHGVRIDLIYPEIKPYLYIDPVLDRAYPKLFDEEWPIGSRKKIGPGMEIKWSPSLKPEVGSHQVQVSEDDGGTWKVCTTCRIDSNGTIQHHGNQKCGFGYYSCLSQNQRYYYRVRALDDAGNPVSEWSNIISAVSYGWPANVELAPPSPKGPYKYQSIVTLNLVNTYGHNLQLKWQITPWSGAMYTVLSGCNDGDSFCQIEIRKGPMLDIAYHLSRSKLAYLKPETSVVVTVIGENVIDGKSFKSFDDVWLIFKKQGRDPIETH